MYVKKYRFWNLVELGGDFCYYIWKEEPITKVSCYNYMNYILYANESDNIHVKTQVPKLNALMGKICGIEQRIAEMAEMKLVLFKALIRSIVFHGAEIGGYREYEQIQFYIKKIYTMHLSYRQK